MTAPPRQRDRSNWARTAIRRMIGTLRYANQELLHAHEAMARPAGAPQPGPRASTAGTGAPAPAGGAGVPPRRQASAAEGGKPAA
jgi:hypothetical protein